MRAPRTGEPSYGVTEAIKSVGRVSYRHSIRCWLAAGVHYFVPQITACNARTKVLPSFCSKIIILHIVCILILLYYLRALKKKGSGDRKKKELRLNNPINKAQGSTPQVLINDSHFGNKASHMMTRMIHCLRCTS